MPMDGILMHQVLKEIEKELPLRINRITQASKFEFIFHTYGKKSNRLYISLHPRYGRIQFTDLRANSNMELTHFLTILRKHLDGGIIRSIKQDGYDRLIEIGIDHRDEMGVIQNNKLYLELMGKYINLVLLDSNNQIIDAYNKISSFEDDSRSIVAGAIYIRPEVFEKESLENLHEDDKYISIRTKYEGVSPILEEEITSRLETESAKDIVDTIFSSDKLYLYDKDYHIIELSHLNKEAKIYPIMEGLDIFYKDLLENERIKDQTGDILRILRRELKRANKKLPKLLDELSNNEDNEHFREKGDLLFAYHSHGKSGLKSIKLKDFENNEIEIELDEKLDGKDNALLYFKKYRKAKNSLDHLLNQIEITENQIAYLKLVIIQTEQASVEDAKEIKEELITRKIIRPSKKKKQEKKAKRPNYLVIEFDEDNTIFVGKNNIQNDTLTFKVAKKDDLWLHVAGTFGSHVILKSNNQSDEALELAAKLAAYFSDARNGSNVEVNYTEIKNIKKIPGANPGMVRFSTHSSIYVTPNYDEIKSYIL